MIQNSRKKEGEIFIQNSLRTRGVRLEDIKILREMSFRNYSRKKQGRGSLEVNITRYYCRETLLLVIKNQEKYPWEIRDQPDTHEMKTIIRPEYSC